MGFPGLRATRPPKRQSNVFRLARAGFTTVELLVVVGLLGLFFLFIHHVFIGGAVRPGEQAIWAGRIVNQFRTFSQHLTQNARRTSVPVTLLETELRENTAEDFQCRIWGQQALFATEAVDVSGSAKPGAIVVRFVEAEPERIGGSAPSPAKITYHLYSLTQRGKLLYHSFTEKVGPTAPPDYIAALRRPTIPPPEATAGRSELLVDDVESIAIERPPESRKTSSGSEPRLGSSAAEPRWPLTLIITCRWPRGQTRRTERITFVSNVPVR